jgi:hypothetical protein
VYALLSKIVKALFIDASSANPRSTIVGEDRALAATPPRGEAKHRVIMHDDHGCLLV